MTTVKVDPNIGDVYLEGIKQTWAVSNADSSTDYAQKNYPAIRKISGDYMMHKITLK